MERFTDPDNQSLRQNIKRVLDFLQAMEDPRRRAILRFHQDYKVEIESSWGSKSKHQAWPGGYIDHLAEVFRIAESMYASLVHQHSLPFNLDSVIVVLYFHDVEKIWKYTTGLPKDFDKNKYLFEILLGKYGIEFSADEINALKYIHGEPEAEYNPETRVMGPLASFCHCADTLSARLWFDEGKGLG